jgi:Aspartyl protease
MKISIQTLLLMVLTINAVVAQTKLPVLRTNNTVLSIKEGAVYHKDIWTIAPELKLDVFTTHAKSVVFYSDIDSMVFNLYPNRQYDFVVLLNGKDSAYNQINTDVNAIPNIEPPMAYSRLKNTNQGADTIPFALGKDDKIHLQGTVNQSDTLDFLFDTGANGCVIVSSLINHKVNLTINGSGANRGSDGIAIVGKSSKNTVQVNNLIWKDVTLLSIDYKKPSFDFVLGWVAFENKIVEINYEKNILVIHPSLPPLHPEYSKIASKLIGGIPYINVKLIVNGVEKEGWFDFDTGSDGTLLIGQPFATENALHNQMQEIGTSSSTGSTGVEIFSKLVKLPKMKLGDYEMYQIPLAIEQQKVKGVEHNENIGNKILKRFNTIIDFKNNFIYIKPNNLYYSPMD